MDSLNWLQIRRKLCLQSGISGQDSVTWLCGSSQGHFFSNMDECPVSASNFNSETYVYAPCLEMTRGFKYSHNNIVRCKNLSSAGWWITHWFVAPFLKGPCMLPHCNMGRSDSDCTCGHMRFFRINWFVIHLFYWVKSARWVWILNWIDIIVCGIFATKSYFCSSWQGPCPLWNALHLFRVYLNKMGTCEGVYGKMHFSLESLNWLSQMKTWPCARQHKLHSPAWRTVAGSTKHLCQKDSFAQFLYVLCWHFPNDSEPNLHVSGSWSLPPCLHINCKRVECFTQVDRCWQDRDRFSIIFASHRECAHTCIHALCKSTVWRLSLQLCCLPLSAKNRGREG